MKPYATLTPAERKEEYARLQGELDALKNSTHGSVNITSVLFFTR